jgi:hypothetical protein
VRQVVITPASSVRDTSVANFSSCSVLDNTSIANIDGGEIRLAARMEDYFDESAVNSSRWTTGVVNSGYVVPPVLQNGSITIDGSWLRSTASVGASDLPVAVEGRVRFSEPGRGTGWGDVGLAKFSQIPGAPNALFLTDNSGNNFANTYQPGAGAPTRNQINGFDWTQRLLRGWRFAGQPHPQYPPG